MKSHEKPYVYLVYPTRADRPDQTCSWLPFLQRQDSESRGLAFGLANASRHRSYLLEGYLLGSLLSKRPKPPQNGFLRLKRIRGRGPLQKKPPVEVSRPIVGHHLASLRRLHTVGESHGRLLLQGSSSHMLAHRSYILLMFDMRFWARANK